MPAFYQIRNHFDHLGDVLGGARLDVWRKHPERIHVFVIRIDVLLGNCGYLHAGLLRRRVDLVIDIGDIPRVNQLVASAQKSRQHVEHDGRTGVTYMRRAVNRWPANIHRDPTAGRRLTRLGDEFFFAPTEGVV